MKSYSVYLNPPEGFQPTVEVSGCYISCEGKLLYLKRHPEKPYGSTWGVPAGKLEMGETPQETVIREIREEIGIELNRALLQYHGALYCRLEKLDYIFYVFSIAYSQFPHLKLAEEEHLEARWVTKDEAFQLDLIVGGKEALNFYLGS